MGDMRDPAAVPFLLQMHDMTYPDEYTARDFKGAALSSLDKIGYKEVLPVSQ